MIEKINITADHVEVSEDLKKYIQKKIGRLDRFINKHARKSVFADVKLKEEQSKKKDKYTVEVILHLPKQKITAKESTLNIFAAIDIVEAKLQNQIRKYKDKASDHKSNRKDAFSKLRKLADKDFWGSQN